MQGRNDDVWPAGFLKPSTAATEPDADHTAIGAANIDAASDVAIADAVGIGDAAAMAVAGHGDTGHGDTGHGDTGHGDTGHGDTGHGGTGHGDREHCGNSAADGPAENDTPGVWPDELNPDELSPDELSPDELSPDELSMVPASGQMFLDTTGPKSRLADIASAGDAAPIVAKFEPGQPVADPGDRQRASAQQQHGRAGSASSRNPFRSGRNGNFSDSSSPIYGALDLGTNNCRLLVARPSRRGFLVIDAFSRIIRLGEGVSRTGTLSPAAMERTLDALRICSDKMRRRGVKRSRLIATEACRIASNGPEFIARVREETGLELEVVSRETEARLAVSGCASLIDHSADWALVFDIGGGSSELIWLDLSGATGRTGRSLSDRVDAQHRIKAWTSLPIGVVTLSERFDGAVVTPEIFETMIEHVTEMLVAFERESGMMALLEGANVHLLGTSGTVTTVAGIHLGLRSYDRNRVDGSWLDVRDVRHVTNSLLHMSFSERRSQPCIGNDRADLVMAGCAIVEALLRMWPCERLRVADRGLREGILATLMAEDGAHRNGRRRGAPGDPRSERN